MQDQDGTEFLCPSSGVYSLYTQQWYLSYRFVGSFRAGPGWNWVPLSIIRSLFTVHSAMVYVIQVCRQLSSRIRMELVLFCRLKAVYKPVGYIPLLSVQWINPWWSAEELSETCRVPCQIKFVKLLHLVGFIIKKFVTLHGHTNVKFVTFYLFSLVWFSHNLK